MRTNNPKNYPKDEHTEARLDKVGTCTPCLIQLVRQTAELGTRDPVLFEKAVQSGQTIIARQFGPDVVPAKVATIFGRTIKRITGNNDPFRIRKDSEIAMARDTLSQMAVPNPVEDLVALAARGNVVDYFRKPEEVAADLAAPVDFAVDHRQTFVERLDDLVRSDRELLYLADNAGEVVFDLPLLKATRRRGVNVVLVVKGGAVQTDCTLKDLNLAHPGPLPFPVIDNGTDAVGTDPDQVSPEFWNRLNRAGLIVAKGMANFETLLDVETPDLLFLMMAKCTINAHLASVPVGTFVAKFRPVGS